MSMYEALVRRLAEVESDVRSARERDCLAAIFRLNNEIGLAARSDQAAAPLLKVLQGHVNSVTTAVKKGDFAAAAASVGKAKAAVSSLTE